MVSKAASLIDDIVTALQGFLERGYAAFVKMRGAHELLHAIEQRETQIMRRLFSGAPEPFDIVGRHGVMATRRT